MEEVNKIDGQINVEIEQASAEINQTNVLGIADKKCILQIYQMLYDVDKIFKLNQIPYWIDGGTLLGSLRHGGLIPWDDDADIDTDIGYANKIYSLKEEFNKYGYDIVKHWVGFKIFRIDGAVVKKYNYKYPYLDIFLTRVNRKGQTAFYSKHASRRDFGNCLFHRSEVYPLKRYKFGEIELFGPNNPYPYLNKLYGGDWNNIAYKWYDHKNEKAIKRLRVELTDEDRKPAEPTGPINKW